MIKDLKTVSETMLIPLWAKAIESENENGLFKDKKAVEILNSIDYDFDKFKQGVFSQLGVSIRTKILDEKVNEFIENHKNPVIINIGSGLDTRWNRIIKKPQRWYELDLPEVIEIKKSIFKENEYDTLISGSILDPSWIKNIKEKNADFLIIAEGLLMYFKEEGIKFIFNYIKDSFKNCEIIAETVSKLICKNSKMHDVIRNMEITFEWGIDEPYEFEKIFNFVKVKEYFNYFDFEKDRWDSLGIEEKLQMPKEKMSTYLTCLSIK